LDQVVCNGSPTGSVVFTGTGTSYTWQNDTPSIGLLATGTGNIGVFNAINTSTVPVTSTIIVTSQFSGGGTTCPGGQQSFTITVNPSPTVVDPLDQVVCNGSSTTQVTFTGTGTSYTWVNNTPSIGLGASGTGSIAPFTAVNNGTTPITATITVTPVFSGGGLNCNGPVQTFTITINPTPSVTDPSDVVVCANVATSSVNFSGTGTSYSWTNNTPGIGLAASGTGNIGSFTAQNTGLTPVVATITVNPDFTGGSTSCPGLSQTFTITVNPIPTVNDLPDQTVCNTSSFQALQFTGTGTGYAWVNNTPSIGLSSNGIGNISSFAGTNTTVSPVTGTVTVTPQYANSGLTCSGVVQTIALTVNPTPSVVDPQDLIVCNGSPTAAVVFNGTGTSYSWTNSNPTIGLLATGTGNVASFTAVNNGIVPVTATITVIPEYSFNGVTCSGPSQSFTITVNPTPTVTDPSDQVVCNGSSTQAIVFTGTGTTYSWVNTVPGIGLAASGNGNIASFTATNGGTTPLSGTITITPQYINVGLTCSGNQQQVQITVVPTPSIDPIAPVSLCNQSTFNQFVPSGTFTELNWTNSNTTVGLIGNGINLVPAFTAVNSSNSVVNSSVINFIPFYTVSNVTCQGTIQSLNLTVLPSSVVNAINDQVYCNGDLTSEVAITGTGTSYSWSNSEISIGLAANGFGNVNAFNTINNSSATVIGTITVTPLFTSNGITCPGQNSGFQFIINPSPQMSALSPLVICNGETVTVPLSASVNSSFTWSATDNLNVIGESTLPQTSSLISNTLLNNSASIQQVNYQVIPTSVPQGCIGSPQTFSVTVVPDIVVTSPESTEICSGGAVNILLTTNVPAEFTWIATDNPQVSGESIITQQGSFIGDLLINNTPIPQLVIYSVFPVSIDGSCVGQPQTVAVLVRPPLDLISPLNAEICSGENIQLPLVANVPANFNWFAQDNPAVNGESVNVQTTSEINDVLVNPTNIPQVVNYFVSASSTLNGCVSPIFTITVIVNPLPELLNQPVDICSEEQLNITLQSNQPVSFTWFAQNNTSVIGETQTQQNSSVINDILINNTSLSQTVTYNVVLLNAITGCSAGPETLSVLVNPLPLVSFTTDGSVLCNLDPVIFVNNSEPGLDFTWDFGDGNTDNLVAPSHVYGTVGTYVVNLTGVNPVTGCTSVFSSPVTLNQSPEVDFSVDLPEGCVVHDVVFTDNINAAGTSLFWDFGDGGNSNQNGLIDHEYDQAGCFDVSLTVTSSNGCSYTSTQNDMVCVYEVPVASFTALSDTMPTENPVFEFVNGSVYATTYVWDFGDGNTSLSTNPIHEYEGTPASHVITLYAYNEVGCVDSAYYTVVVLEELLVYVPNTFTPNNDVLNNTFKPIMTAGFDRFNYQLLIFNRWGEIIFESLDPDIGWDGSYNGTIAQDGVYTWNIKFGILQNEDAKEMTGHVNLIR
jgi:gliding motility-associated-like protein